MHLLIYIVTTCIFHILVKRERGETSSKFSFQPYYALDFCLELRVGSPAWLLFRLWGSLYRREFSFYARRVELRIFVNKQLQESFNRILFLFDEAERIRIANITSSTKQLYWFSTNLQRYAWRGNQSWNLMLPHQSLLYNLFSKRKNVVIAAQYVLDSTKFYFTT